MDLLVADLVTALIMAFIGTVGWYLTRQHCGCRGVTTELTRRAAKDQRRVVHGYVGVLLLATAVALAILDMVAR